jgi:hypothetical protein
MVIVLGKWANNFPLFFVYFLYSFTKILPVLPINRHHTMKQQTAKKLSLKKATLTNLNPADMGKIKGGATTLPCATKFCTKAPQCYSWHTEAC